MRIRSLEKPSPRQSTSDEVDLEKNKQDNGMMFAPQEVLEIFLEKRRTKQGTWVVRLEGRDMKEKNAAPHQDR